MDRPAVILGLDSVTGLQSARILARRGVSVLGVARDRDHFACRTRACDVVVEADPSESRVVQTLHELVSDRRRPAFLLPCSDEAVLAVSEHRRALAPHFRFVLPPHAVVRGLVDKSTFTGHAEQAGLTTPRTVTVDAGVNLREAVAELEFPLVVKPAVKNPGWESQMSAKAVRVDHAEGLAELERACTGWAPQLIVQEWIEGAESDLWSCNCYLDRSGAPLVAFVARKLRQWPPDLGTSSLGEEAPNPSVLHQTLRLFAETGHRGLGYVEFKHDARQGRDVVIEANVGRPTGRSAIAELAGTELLYTAYCDALSRPLPQSRRQPYVGTKWIYARRDVQAVLHRWRRDGQPLKDLLRAWKGVRHDAVFSWRDPAPFWSDVRRTALSRGRALGALLRGAPEDPAAGRDPHERGVHGSRGRGRAA